MSTDNTFYQFILFNRPCVDASLVTEPVDENSPMPCQVDNMTLTILPALTPLDINAREDIRKDLPQYMKILLEKGEILYETEHRAKDENTIPVEINCHSFKLNSTPSALSIARDITERKRVEAILKEQEEKYHNLFSSIRDAILVADVQRRIINCNPAFTDLFGYELDEIRGKFTEYVYNSQAEYDEMGRKIRENINNPQFLYTVQYKKKNGTTFPGETNVFMLQNSQGGITGFIGLIRDITARITMEKELRASELRYRKVTETSHDAIISVDKNGKIVSWNQGAEDMFRYSPGEQLGKPVTGLMPPRYRRRHREGMRRLLTGGKPSKMGKPIEVEGLRKDGTEIPLELSLSQWEVGGALFFTAIIRDISERKKSIQAIKRYTDRITAINKAAHTLGKSLNLDAVLKDCLTIAREMFQADAVTVFQLDEKRRDLSILATTRSATEISRSFRIKVGEGLTGKVVQSGQARLVNRIDKTDIGIFIPGTPVEPESLMSVPLYVKPSVFGAISVSRLGYEKFEPEDLTCLQNVADLGAVAIQNSRLYEASQESDRMKTFFIANMSHEIRTPLNSILGFSSLLETSIKDRLNAEERQYFGTLQKSGQRLIRTIHEMLDISQLETGTYKAYPTPVSLQEIVVRIFRELQLDADNKKLEYVMDIATGDDTTVIIDEPSLYSMITNLIDNAIKYTSRGQVAVILCGNNGKLQLQIRDTGEGIEPKYLKRIFEPFTQESEGYTKKYQGIGLGMALVKKYCDLNQVPIKIDSVKHEGTTVTLTFQRAYQ